MGADRHTGGVVGRVRQVPGLYRNASPVPVDHARGGCRLGVALLAGVRVRLAALASGVLLLTFAIAMTTALGPEAPLSYSVWTAAAGAFLLAQDRPAACQEPQVAA